MTGTVKKFMEDKGFGFITPDEGGDDVFIHIEQCNGATTLSEGDQVSYDSVWNDRKGKMQGDNCTVISSNGGGGGGGYGGDKGKIELAGTKTAVTYAASDKVSKTQWQARRVSARTREGQESAALRIKWVELLLERERLLREHAELGREQERALREQAELGREHAERVRREEV